MTDAIYQSGLNANRHFLEKPNNILGTTSCDFRSGGSYMDIFFATGECSLGSILVAQSARGVCSILIGEDPALLARDLQVRFPEANLISNENNESVAKVAGLVEKPGSGFDLPLDIRGTVFQQLCLARIAADTTWIDGNLYRHCQPDRNAWSSPGGRSSLRCECVGRRHPVPPRD